MEIPIIIPTHARAHIISSHKHIIKTVICCPESQRKDYEKTCKGYEILTHPDSVIGLQNKRQWIYDRFRNVFMMDDDLMGLSRMTAKKGEKSKIDPELGYWLIQNAANLAKLSGCHLFGFNNYVVNEHYTGHVPISVTGFINACGWGFLEGGYDKLKFNPKLRTNEDFYISALNAYHFRKVFIDRRYCFQQRDSFGRTMGGAADLRTNNTEAEDLVLLKQYFGDAIQVKSDYQIRGKKKTPPHATAKRLIIPFGVGV